MLIVLVALSFYYIPQIRIDSSLEKFLVSNDPERPYYDEALKYFGSDNKMIVAIKDDNLFTNKKLTIIADLVDDLSQIDGMEEVNSLFNQKNIIYRNNQLYNQLFIDADDIPESKKTLFQIKQDAINNPLTNKIFISKDGKYLFLDLTLENKTTSAFYEYMVNSIQNKIDKYSSHFEKVFQFGSSYINYSVMQNIINALKTTVPLGILVIILVLYLNIKSVKLTFIPILTGGLSVLLTLGFMGFAHLDLTLITSLVPVLLLLIGSTEDSHLITEFLTESKNSKDKDIIIKTLSSKISIAIILTAVTTVIGFASIYVNDIKMLKEFAIVSAFGLTINFLITLVVVPNYLYITELEDDFQTNVNYSFLIKMAKNFFLKPSKIIFTLLIVTTGISIYYLLSLKIDNNLLNYFKEDSVVQKRAHFITAKTYGAQSFYITVRAKHKGDFRKYEYLKELEKIKKFILRKDNDFNFAISVADHISIVNKAMQNGNNKYYRVPKNNNLTAQYLLMFHKKDLKSYVTNNFELANIVVWHDIFSSSKFNEEKEELAKFITKNIDPRLEIHISGQNILINKAADTISYGQFYSIALTLLMIFLTISIRFKDFRFGIISVIPNVIPIIFVFGVMGMFNIPLNVVTAMVATITFGIVVDDTIHIMSRFKYEVDSGLNKIDALVETMHYESKAVILTSLSLSIGFLTFLTSSFVAVIEYAILSVIAILVALLVDIFVTPTLINIFQKDKK